MGWACPAGPPRRRRMPAKPVLSADLGLPPTRPVRPTAPVPMPCTSPHSFGPAPRGHRESAPAAPRCCLGPSALTVDVNRAARVDRTRRPWFGAFDSGTEPTRIRPGPCPTFGPAMVGTCGVAATGRRAPDRTRLAGRRTLPGAVGLVPAYDRTLSGRVTPA